MMKTTISLLFFTSLVTSAQVIPSNRLVTWQGNVGIPGGIPTNRPIFTTISPANSTAAIQQQLNSATINTVVLLTAGTHTLTAQLHIPSGVTLRGAGMGQTILQESGSYGQPNTAIWFGNASDSYGSQINIVSGATQGSTQITLASPVSSGTYLSVTCNDPSYVSNVGGAGGGVGYYNYPWPKASSIGNIGQIIEVTAVNGNTITFNPPLTIDYSNGGQVWVNNIGAKFAGVEDLTIQSSGGGVAEGFWIQQGAYCWAKNVEDSNPDSQQALIRASFRCEVRSCFFHDGRNHSPGTDDTLLIDYRSTGILVEDNIFLRLHPAVMLQGGVAYSVFAYNFNTNNFDSGDTYVYATFDTHGAHPSFNLFEGNVGCQIFGDAYWGTSSHNTVFRNYFSCSDWRPAGNWANAGVWGVICSWAAQNYNIVGNIIGSSYVVANGGVTENDWSAVRRGVACLMFGYDSAGDGGAYFKDSTVARTTAILEGNWDIVSGQQHWSGSPLSLSISYYTNSKPAYFGILSFPPMNPANALAFQATNIPAGYRFYLGSNPPSGGNIVNTNPVIAVTPASLSFGTNGPDLTKYFQ